MKFAQLEAITCKLTDKFVRQVKNKLEPHPRN